MLRVAKWDTWSGAFVFCGLLVICKASRTKTPKNIVAVPVNENTRFDAALALKLFPFLSSVHPIVS